MANFSSQLDSSNNLDVRWGKTHCHNGIGMLIHNYKISYLDIAVHHAESNAGSRVIMCYSQLASKALETDHVNSIIRHLAIQ